MDLPQSYLDQPRWWSGDGNDWLAALPAFVAAQSERWRLTADGEFTHGSHALIVPVVRDGERLVLRLSPPDDDVESHVRALRFWAGHGTVQLVEADVGRGAMLLERLGPSLTQVPSEEAVAVLGRVMRRLGVPAPADVPATSDIVRERAAALESEWLRLDAPFERTILDEALAAAVNLAGSDTDLAVNGDLHSGQILRGSREPWLVVDPVLLRGDIAYDLGRVLWTRLDDMRDDAAIVQHFDIAVDTAGLDRDHARDWVLFRTVDYWLWGQAVGLTEDPVRCERLIRAVY